MNWGPFFVAAGASLWATDALLRVPLLTRLDPTWIVLIEHGVGLAALAPWVFFKHRGNLAKLTLPEWLGCLLIGAGGSALATVLFTASFKYLNPSVSILLQKTQPILVTLISMIALGERPARAFFGWAPVALLAALVVTFPHLDFLRGGFDPHSEGISLSLAAAGLWALATVAGRAVLRRVPPSIAAFWRFAFGALTLLLFVVLADVPAPGPLLDLSRSGPWLPLLYMGLVPGMLAMLLYYRGLATTSASVAAFVELIFPVSAVALNTWVLKAPLQPVQLVAGAILLIAVFNLSRSASAR